MSPTIPQVPLTRQQASAEPRICGGRRIPDIRRSIRLIFPLCATNSRISILHIEPTPKWPRWRSESSPNIARSRRNTPASWDARLVDAGHDPVAALSDRL